MLQKSGQASRFALLQGPLLIFLLLLLPVLFSNHPGGTLFGFLLLAVLFFFPGYLLLSAVDKHTGGLRILLSPICGIVTMTTAYDVFARASIAGYFPYLVVVLSFVGMFFFVRRIGNTPARTPWTRESTETLTAASAVALIVAPLFWRTGRLSDGEFVFYGPAGHDHLFHLTLLQRLLHHVPPDNFIVSGLRAPVYHYFDDLALALVLRAQSALHLGTTDLFDLYYRCYPTLVYFLLGALAYRTGKQLVGSARGGVLGLLLLLGAGGLGWFFGALQSAAHFSQFAVMRASLFTDWTSWDGVNSILPLVHRPAHYSSLLICLAAINIVMRPGRTRRDWIPAGLLLGLMAGFNLTLAATFGVAGVLGALLLLFQRRHAEARDLAWFAIFIFIGSLPVNAGMLLAGFHNTAPGFPFSGPNLQFPITAWGGLLYRIVPASLLPWACLIMFPIIAYGIKLFGLGAMAHLDLGAERHRGVAMVFAIVFGLSFLVGTFFPYQAFGGVGIVFLQPSLWILALFSLRPIDAWLEHSKGGWRPLALWGILGLTWVQALGSFNFSHKVAFTQDTAQALHEVHLAAATDDVVAYEPTALSTIPIWGRTETVTNFAVMALTGLDGYFSSDTYSRFFAVPGLSGRNPAEVLAQADRLYEQRRGDVESFLQGNIEDAARTRLSADHVRWIVVVGDASQSISSPAIPWRKTRDVAIYRLP